MGKKILAVIIGYVVMVAFIFITFTVAYLAMGADGAFNPGVYDVSTLWIAITIVLGIVAAILGGLVCVMIAKTQQAAKILAGLVLALGLAVAIPVAMGPDEDTPDVRSGDVAVMESMKVARQPIWVAFLNPFIGVMGVMIGARLKK
ncbi:MAG: hypothetical protein IH914_04055 [candidate division Zixibacteria bacterium]|nr:hypothetical protein [candidate division Zixibacteria bacterium]